VFPQLHWTRIGLVFLLVLVIGIDQPLCKGQAHEAVTAPAIHLANCFSSVLALGHDDPGIRQDALKGLSRDGVTAWDRIRLGCNFSDPEISVTCQRLLERIPFEVELSKHVSWLGKYRHANRVHRERMIIRLGQSGDENHQIALALLTRFERDDHLARLAALELITGQYQPTPELSDRMGGGAGPASEWLRSHLLTAGRYRDFVEIWHPVATSLSCDPWCKKQPQQASRFFRWYTTELLIRGRQAEAQWSLDQTIRYVVNQPAAVIETVDWLFMNNQIKAIEQLLNRFPEMEKQDGRLVFRRAELVRLQGDVKRAKKMVEHAWSKQPEFDAEMQLQYAVHLRLAGLRYWSELLLERLQADDELAPSLQVQVGLLTAESHYEVGEFAEAEKAISQVVHQSPRQKSDSDVVLLPVSLESRSCLYAYLTARQKGDWENAGDLLLDGLAATPSNSDLLIAMWRHSDPRWSAQDESAWRVRARQMVDLALLERMHQIRVLRISYDADARQRRIRKNSLMLELNSYAWLASKTGMHLIQAEAYAREASAIAPADGRVLDTLAACLFARGKLEEAVFCQNQAFRQAPWSPQIRAGLAQYRQVAQLTGMPHLIR